MTAPASAMSSATDCAGSTALRLIQALVTVTDQQRAVVTLVRQLIRSFYHDLKAYGASPSAQAQARLKVRKAELRVALDRPEVPLNTNDSEHDTRDPVTIRKISGGTCSEDGRGCRDTVLSLKKTSRKNAISFLAYLGDRLGIAARAGRRAGKGDPFAAFRARVGQRQTIGKPTRPTWM